MSFIDHLKKAKDYLDNSKFRQWIDGEDTSGDPANNIQINKTKNDIEEFLAQISRTVFNLMQMKKFVIPGGEVYLPDSYTVFLAPRRDKELQGRMREFFLKGLQSLASEAAAELVGASSGGNLPVRVELRVDGTLIDRSVEYRVQVSDSETGKTGTFESQSGIEDDETIVQLPDEKTVVEISNRSKHDDELTVVETDPYYRIEIRHGDELTQVYPVMKREMRIGRASRTSELDIELANEKISRRHATLTLDADDNLWLTHHGQNTTTVNGIRCNQEEKRLVKPGQKIEIENYQLLIR